jgi:ubiquinone/menaquinone biosynthesis C-methylase UbiE
MNIIRTPDLEGATLSQQWRVFKAERLHLGPWCTRGVVWAEMLESAGYRDAGPMGEVTPVELQDLYLRIQDAPTPSDRYSILAEKIPDKAQLSDDADLVWFDIIHGLTAPHIAKSVGQAAYELVANGTQPWKKALDLGSGTGNIGSLLLGYGETPKSATSVVALDMEKSLLALAGKRYPEMQPIQGDATSLPFVDGSIDLVVSGGMMYAMKPHAQRQAFQEVSRVLSPGGVYLDGNYQNPYLHPDSLRGGPKSGLESFIVGTISPRDVLPAIIQEVLKPDDFAQLGLEQSTREYYGSRDHETTIVRVLKKLPS